MAVSCTIDERALREAGGSVLAEGDGVAIGGWEITCSKRPITADVAIEKLKEEFRTVGWPEQYFGGNHLTLTHVTSGTRIAFTAKDALRRWRELGAAPIQVQSASRWMRLHEEDFKKQRVEFLKYDWTFTTDYGGSITRGEGQSLWQPSDAVMDRRLLTARDPILLFADIPLYESELEDNGVAALSVKIRVMPQCWYVLLRFWLRVDGVLLRLQTTRLFCKFGAGTVLREVMRQEGTFRDLRADGAPAEGPVYRDPETAAAALSAISPVGVTLHVREELVLADSL